MSGAAFTAEADCRSKRDSFEAFVMINGEFKSVEKMCSFIGQEKVMVAMNCSVEYLELRDQLFPLLYSLNEQILSLQGSPLFKKGQSLKRSTKKTNKINSQIGSVTSTVLDFIPHPFAQIASKMMLSGTSILSYILQLIDSSTGTNKIAGPVFTTSNMTNLKLNTSAEVFYLENPWLDFSSVLHFKNIRSKFLRLRSQVNQLLSVSSPIVFQLQNDDRPLSKSILDKLQGRPFVKHDGFDTKSGILRRTFIWAEPKKHFPIQQYCIVPLKSTFYIKQGVLSVNSTTNNYLSCIKQIQTSGALDKTCFGTATVPGPYDIFPFVVDLYQVSVIRIIRAKLVYVSCKSDSQSWLNEGIIIILASSSCLVQIDANIIQHADPNVATNMTFQLLVNMDFSHGSQKEYLSQQAENFERLSDEMKGLLRDQNVTFNSDIDMLQIFDIGISSAFLVTAFALIVLFCKLSTKKRQKNDASKSNAVEMKRLLK